jgi:tetratricopeptide (TPR) repeat protein
MLTDNEIRKATEDSLGFRALAQTLKEIVCSSETPLTIGVYGEWGSGKTSLMRMTQDLLEGGAGVKTIWFDAWKFDKSYDLRVALIHTILRKIQEDKSTPQKIKEKAEELLKRVNWFGLGKAALSFFVPSPLILQLLNEPLLKNAEDIPGKTLELIGDFEDKFKDLAQDYVGKEGRLVVFIDDLDRCIPEKAIDVLEAIKLFLNVPGSVFIIGADKKVIEDGILQRYGERFENWGKHYLDKIIQIPVSLPPLRKDIITERFIQGLNISDEIKKYASIIAEVGDNPRTIKRLLNRFEIQRILGDKRELEVKSEVMAKLTVVEFRWPDFYTDLISVYSETETNLVQVLKNISKSEEAERAKELEKWGTLKKYFDDKGLMDFLKEKPLLEDISLDHYVYLVRSTTELKESAINYFNIAYSFGEKGEHVKAIENYDKAIDLDPKYEKAWYNKGWNLSELGRREEAIACYDKAIDLDPKYEKAWYNKGWELSQLGRREEAIACYDKAIELNPRYEQAWYGKGYELGQLGRYEEAIACYDKAIELNPKYEKAWYGRGVRLGELGRYEEAIACYDKAIELNPKYEKAWHGKGVRLGELGRHEEAIACYDKAIELNPRYEKAWYGKGYELGQLGRHEEAIACYDKAIELNPKYEEAWHGKGWSLKQLGQKDKAEKCFQRAKELGFQGS